MPAPELGLVHVINGVGDSRMIVAHYKYPSEEPRQAVFVGSLHGTPGPIHLKVGGLEVHVESPWRFGETFDEAWVRAFYTATDEEQGLDHQRLVHGNLVAQGRTGSMFTLDVHRPPRQFSFHDDELADREADRIDNLHFNRDGL